MLDADERASAVLVAIAVAIILTLGVKVENALEEIPKELSGVLLALLDTGVSMAIYELDGVSIDVGIISVEIESGDVEDTTKLWEVVTTIDGVVKEEGVCVLVVANVSKSVLADIAKVVPRVSSGVVSPAVEDAKFVTDVLDD